MRLREDFSNFTDQLYCEGAEYFEESVGEYFSRAVTRLTEPPVYFLCAAVLGTALQLYRGPDVLAQEDSPDAPAFLEEKVARYSKP